MKSPFKRPNQPEKKFLKDFEKVYLPHCKASGHVHALQVASLSYPQIEGEHSPTKTSRGILEGDPLEHVSLYFSTDVKHSKRNSRSRFIAV